MKKAILLTLSIAFLVTSSCKKGDDDNPVNPQDSAQNAVDSPYIKRVDFKTSDDVLVSADIYHVNRDYPMIVLCHREGKSRGEYKEIAPKFNELGYNCLAIDQRSGEESNQVTNRTAWFYKDRAKGIPEDYIDSEKDIVAAIDYAYNFSAKNLILLGSGYSAGLAMKVANENNKVNMVLAFGLRDKFSPLLDIKAAIAGLDKPTFICSSTGTASITKEFFDIIIAVSKVHFIPSVSHSFDGIIVIEPSYSGSGEYWDAMKYFLGK